MKFISAGTASRLAGFGRRATSCTARCRSTTPPAARWRSARCCSRAARSRCAASSARASSGATCARTRSTSFQYIGEFCRYLLNQPPDPRDGEHALAFCIGNGLRPDIWEAFRDRFRIPRIVEFYGATEGNVSLLNLDNKVGSVGRIPSKLLMDARLVRYDVERDEHARDANGRLDRVRARRGRRADRRAAAPRGRQPRPLRGLHLEGGDRAQDPAQRLRGGRRVLPHRRPPEAGRGGLLLLRRPDRRHVPVEGRERLDPGSRRGDRARIPGVELANVYGVEVPGGDGRAGMAALRGRRPGRLRRRAPSTPTWCPRCPPTPCRSSCASSARRR